VGSTLIGGVLDFFAPGLGTLLSSLYQARLIARTKLGYQLGSIAIGVMSAVYCKGAVAQCNALGQAGWAALAGHSASDVIRTGVMAYVSASVNKQIGDTFKLGSMTFYNTVAHGVWGCAEAKLNGGACSSGFRGGLAGAALSNYADLEYNKGSEGVNFAVNTAIHAVTGGLASLAGGGKFAEGATSAAFAYLFNELGHQREQKTDYKLEPVPDTPETRAAYDRLQSLADVAAVNVDTTCGWRCNLPWIRGTLIHSEFEALVTSLGPASGFTAEVSYKNGVVVPYGTAGSSRADVVFGSLAAPTAVYDLKTGWAYMSIGQAKAYGANLPTGTPFTIIRPKGR
jgi:hypothetical protein